MQFQILGPLRVTNGNQSEIPLGGAKPAAVLALLLLRANELVSADALIEDLWDGQPPVTAPKTLQVHISRLRRALGESDPIVTTRGGYLLEVEPDALDALRFEQLVGEGGQALAEGAHARASARLRQALSLWRGDALADFRYASFAQDAIARLDGLRTVAFESAVEAELALGRHAELIPELKLLVKRHPLSEHTRAQLMLALYRSGRQAEALGVYRVGRRILVEQLGIEPSEEIRDLERRILEQDPGLMASAPQARPARDEQTNRGAFVGYERELGALEDLLEQALQGRGQIAVIAGEPGVGKSRLADELAAVARTRGAQVLWGRCRRGAGAPAYWPWVQVLRGLIADRDERTLRAEIRSGGADLCQVLPELRDLLPGVEPNTPADAADARFRLFDSAGRFVVKASASRPIVIVLDDLHAADESTLAMLQSVAPQLLDAPVLVVATYRDTQADLDRPLSDALVELARETDCVQLVLTGLSVGDTAHFVELSAGVSPMPRLTAAIQEASAGNPLFVTELVRLLRVENRLEELAGDELALPRGVEQVIGRRVEHLSERCRGTLSLAAVVGRDFSLTLIERAGDLEAADLLDDIEAAMAARVLDSGDTRDEFRFSHDLVRTALYSELGQAERRRLHAAVGEALEQLHHARPESVAAALAHHFDAALPGADTSKAVRYLALAGDVAAEQSAWTEAASDYARAAELGSRDGLPADELWDIYVKLAEQRVLLAQLRSAAEAIDAAEALGVSTDPARARRIGIVRAHLTMLNTDGLDPEPVLDAVEFFQQAGDAVGEARAWGALVQITCGLSERTKEGEAAARMLECAKRSGSRALLGQALRGQGAALANGVTPVSVALPQVRGLLDEAPDATVRGRLWICMAVLAAAQGHFEQARALLDESRATVPRAEHATLTSTWLSYAARIENLAGNHRRAEELARELCDGYWAEGLVAFLSSELTFLVDALIHQGRLDEAAAELARAEPLAAPDDVDALFRQARSRARLELARGNLEAAEGAARRAVAKVAETQTADERAETLLVLARVLATAGRDSEGREVAAEALRISEERENVPLAQQARDLLATADYVGLHT